MAKKVGEEYWGDWYYDNYSPSGVEVRLKYRVVEIVKVKKYGTYGEEVDVERIEAIAKECRPHIFSWGGNEVDSDIEL